MDIVHYFKPVDHLDQAIYRDILRSRQKEGEEFAYESHSGSPKELKLRFNVVRLPRQEQEGEYTSLGKLALTGFLLARAAVSRRPQDWAGALCAGAVTLIGGDETLRKARSAVKKMFRNGLGQVSFKVCPNEAVLTYEAQEVHISLAPMKQVVIRALRYQGEPESMSTYCLHVDLQDGRVLPLFRGQEPLAGRRLGHQAAQALQLPMVFQNVEICEVKNGFSWEMGPQLVEPALN
jgi:hypothetical protein